MDTFYLIKLIAGVFTFSVGILNSIIAYLGIFSFIFFFTPRIKRYFDKNKTKIRRIGIPLSVLLLLFSFIISSYDIYHATNTNLIELEGQIQAYESLPTSSELVNLSYLQDVPILLSEFSKDMKFIANRTFDNCDILGPAVVYLNFGTNQIFSCTIDVPFDSAFITTNNTSVVGVVAFDNCTFKNCRFKNIGFLGNQESIDNAMKGYIFETN